MKLSASKVDCFLGCRRLFLYRYINKLPAKPKKYFLIGNVCHKALELFYTRATMDNKHLWSKLMAATFKHSLNKYHGFEQEKKGFIDRDDLYNMKEMLKNHLVYIDGKLPVIESAEKNFTITINELIIRGKADRVDKVDDGFIIMDYKTSSKPLTKKDVTMSVQLPTYGLWLRQLYPNEKYYGQYIYLRHLKKKQKIELTGEIMADAIEKYTLVKFSLENGCKMVRNSAYKYCFICEHGMYCNRDKQDDFYKEEK